MKRSNAKLRRELKNMSKQLTRIIEKNQHKYAEKPKKREVKFDLSFYPKNFPLTIFRGSG